MLVHHTLIGNEPTVRYMYELPLSTDLKDTHSAHIKPVAAFCLYHTDEDTVAGRAAYDGSHAVHVDSKLTNGIGYAAARTGCLYDRHFKWKYLLNVTF